MSIDLSFASFDPWLGLGSPERVDLPLDERIGRAVRRDDGATLTCAACGCRLTPRTSLGDGAGQGPDVAWRHFPGFSGADARGCRVACTDSPHRIAEPVIGRPSLE